MLGHFHRLGHQPFGIGQPVDETDLVKPLRCEAEPERHFHGDGVGEVGDMAVVVAAQQPALGFRYFEHSLLGDDAEIARLHQFESAAHGEAVDRRNDRLFQRAGGQGMDESIVTYIRRKYGVIISNITAEQLKIKIGAAVPQDTEQSMEVQGQDQVSGLPRPVTLSTSEIVEALQEPLRQLTETCR